MGTIGAWAADRIPVGVRGDRSAEPSPGPLPAAAVERRVRRELIEGGTGPSAASVDDRTDLARALAALPVRQREVTVYHYAFLDLEVSEIARVLRSPEGTVKSALFRARRSLAGALRIDDDMEVRDVAR